jgi:opacity protein-like surface antigen
VTVKSIQTGLYYKPGVADSYQSDFDFTSSSFTAGCGIMLNISDNLTFDAGFSYAFIKDSEVSFYDPHLDDIYLDTYARTSMIIAAGLSYRISR